MKYRMLRKGEIVRKGDEVCHSGASVFALVHDSIGKKVGCHQWVIGAKVRRPLKSAVAARSASTNIGYAAALWKELRRRNGGKFPAKQDWVAITRERLNAALKAAQHCA